MKAFISACIVALVIAIAGVFILDGMQKPSEQAFSSATGVRL